HPSVVRPALGLPGGMENIPVYSLRE
ncbi:MAG: hypothetical protein H6R26_1119, partial [Proteobacteria bacterium]|nr:hypothetical protein [Pseudomonadota bacterium]